ncbi:MAG TPA: DUF4136 domain-containing protein [Allosphingosinicella sp.]|nr:DUF4136 domain-containing protein [Allosphingosinicella sp.]
MSILLLASSLAACATERGSGLESSPSVTRFHLGQEIARGEIRVEPTNPGNANSIEFARIAASVERELARLGWRIARGNARSEQVALVRIDQGSREAMRSRSGVSVGIGGGSGGWGRSGVGVGVGASIPIGSRSSEIVVTELGVRIQRRSDATVAWEGRAELEARAGTPLAEPAAAADRLAAALFQDFPGESGRTIRVR